jgi:hypothetical protein
LWVVGCGLWVAGSGRRVQVTCNQQPATLFISLS